MPSTRERAPSSFVGRFPAATPRGSVLAGMTEAREDEEEAQRDTYETPKLPMEGMSDCAFVASLAVFIFGSFALALTFAMMIIHGLIDPVMDDYSKTHNITRGASTDKFFDLKHLGSTGLEHRL